jgi:nucleotide-binding universal stress UspA family protein
MKSAGSSSATRTISAAGSPCSSRCSTPPFVTYGEFHKAMEDPEGYRRELEGKLRESQAPTGSGGVEHRLEQGDPAAEIVRVAEELPADFIVLGTHGRTGLLRLLMGSVAEEVVRKAPCPVLTIRVPLRAVPADQESPAAEGVV